MDPQQTYLFCGLALSTTHVPKHILSQTYPKHILSQNISQTYPIPKHILFQAYPKTYPIPNISQTYPIPKHILSQTFYEIVLSTFTSSGYSFNAAIFMLKVLNKWSWQINYVLYFSFDIQANYNILNKIIIYFSTDNFLAFLRIAWEGSQKHLHLLVGVYMYKNWVFAPAYK